MKLKWIFFSFFVFVLFNAIFILSQVEVEVGESSVTLCDPLEEGCDIEYTFEEGIGIFKVKESSSYLVINDHPYFNLDEGSFFKVDEKGKLFEAFIIASNESTYVIGEDFYKLSLGQTLKFKDGKIEIGGGEVVEGKPALFDFEFFPKGGKSISIESKELIFIDFDEEGNYIISGNFLLEGNEVKGVEGGKGKITVSNLGKINKIWENTKVKINSIGYRYAVEKPLNIYYEAFFNPKDHENENYFNHGLDNIFIGGQGFSFELLENNFLYPKMEFERKIFGSDEIKKSDFVVELLGGSLQISEKESKLIIDSEGDFNIKDGMIRIFSRNGMPYFLISEENNDFAQDLILNNDYVLEDSKLTYRKIPIKFNIGPWENTIKNAKNYDYEKRDMIIKNLKEEYGVRARDYHGFVNDGREEQIAKWTYEAVNSANNNKYGIKISPSELFTTAMLEGLAGDYSFLDERSDINYYNNPSAPVNSLEDVGIDFLGHPDERARLEAGGFIPEDLGFIKSESDITLEYGTPIYPGDFANLGEALKGVAGVLAQRKYAFTKDFIEAYGEEEFNKLSNDKKMFWTSVYYNFGEGSARAELRGEEYYIQKGDKKIKIQGSGREFFSRVEKERVASDIYNVKNNAMIKVAAYELIKEMKYFSFF